jgi:hypothetical protein
MVQFVPVLTVGGSLHVAQRRKVLSFNIEHGDQLWYRHEEQGSRRAKGY